MSPYSDGALNVYFVFERVLFPVLPWNSNMQKFPRAWSKCSILSQQKPHSLRSSLHCHSTMNNLT